MSSVSKCFLVIMTHLESKICDINRVKSGFLPCLAVKFDMQKGCSFET
jgi:hypothetical protein